jgi:hypothetical protein
MVAAWKGDTLKPDPQVDHEPGSKAVRFPYKYAAASSESARVLSAGKHAMHP